MLTTCFNFNKNKSLEEIYGSRLRIFNFIQLEVDALGFKLYLRVGSRVETPGLGFMLEIILFTGLFNPA